MLSGMPSARPLAGCCSTLWSSLPTLHCESPKVFLRSSPLPFPWQKRRRIIEGLKDQFDLLGLPCEWLPDPMCSCGKREFERRCFDARELLRGALFVYGQFLMDLEARARARTVQCEGDFDTTTLCNCRCGGCDKVTPMGLEWLPPCTEFSVTFVASSCGISYNGRACRRAEFFWAWAVSHWGSCMDADVIANCQCPSMFQIFFWPLSCL